MKVVHPFAPVYDENSKILILGSFPSVRSRADNFYYAHPQNRFWRLLAKLYRAEIPQTVEEKKESTESVKASVANEVTATELKVARPFEFR